MRRTNIRNILLLLYSQHNDVTTTYMDVFDNLLQEYYIKKSVNNDKSEIYH